MFRAPIKLVMTWGWFMALPHPEWIDDIDDPQHDWIKSCIIHLLTMAHLKHCYDYSIFWHHIQSNPHEFSAVSPVKKKKYFWRGPFHLMTMNWGIPWYIPISGQADCIKYHHNWWSKSSHPVVRPWFRIEPHGDLKKPNHLKKPQMVV